VASTEAPISITVKTPAGSLVTLRAEGGEDLDQMVATSIDALKAAVIELEAAAKGVTPVQQQPMAPAQIATTLGASIIDNPQPAGGGWGSAPSINGRNCPHGRMTSIQGTGKDGQMYRGYFCPAPKGAIDKCSKNQYVRAGSPEWATFVADQVK
jgi:hypothetical protein